MQVRLKHFNGVVFCAVKNSKDSCERAWELEESLRRLEKPISNRTGGYKASNHWYAKMIRKRIVEAFRQGQFVPKRSLSRDYWNELLT